MSLHRSELSNLSHSVRWQWALSAALGVDPAVQSPRPSDRTLRCRERAGL